LSLDLPRIDKKVEYASNVMFVSAGGGGRPRAGALGSTSGQKFEAARGARRRSFGVPIPCGGEKKRRNMEKKKVILTYAVGCFSQKKLDNLKD
jgi:hypothetical protein